LVINVSLNFLWKNITLGIINAYNILKTDLNQTLDQLLPIHQKLQDRLWLALSSSLLHVPIDLDNKEKLDYEVKS
jgi:5-methyltetrahydropteroyltriglutamate--homocysteine methyltransferase